MNDNNINQAIIFTVQDIIETFNLLIGVNITPDVEQSVGDYNPLLHITELDDHIYNQLPETIKSAAIFIPGSAAYNAEPYPDQVAAQAYYDELFNNL